MNSQSQATSDCKKIRLYEHVQESERELMHELREAFPRVFSSVSQRKMLAQIRATGKKQIPKLQGFDDTLVSLKNKVASWFMGTEGAIINGVKIACNKLLADESIEMVVNIFETVPLIITQVAQSSGISQLLTALVVGLKMLCRRPLIFAAISHAELIQKWIGQMWEPVTQAGDGARDACEDILSCARSWMEGAANFSKSECFGRFEKLFKYLLSFGVFTSLGLDFEVLGVTPFEMSRVKRDYSSRTGFVFTLCREVVWILERGMQAVRLGSFSPFYHSAEEYRKWSEEAYMLIEDEAKLSNEEATGINYSDFLCRLETALERGKIMSQFALEKSEKVTLALLMSRLRLLRTRRCVEDAAQKGRPSPDTILVFGDSCVAKSKFCEILFHYYGTLCGLDVSPDKMYTRCFSDAFWSGFKTFKWCIRLDDIALQKPSLGVMDPSLSEVIQIANNVPYTPPQAALEDKGQNPLKPSLVIGTTNTESLNANAYFSEALAVQRRFKYHVVLNVKDEYRVRDEDGTTSQYMIDPSRIPVSTIGEYPNLWNITVNQVVSEGGGDGKVSHAKLQEIIRFEEVNDFLFFWGNLIKESHANGIKEQGSTRNMASVHICRTCCRVGCESCPELQSGEIDEETNADTLEEQERADRELHDRDPAKWVQMTLMRIRSGDWIPFEDVAELNVRTNSHYNFSQWHDGVMDWSEGQPACYDFEDVVSETLESVGLERIADAYVTTKMFAYHPRTFIRSMRGVVEHCCHHLGVVSTGFSLARIQATRSIKLGWALTRVAFHEHVDRTASFLDETIHYTEILVNTIARLMARGIKWAWSTVTEPFVAYATYRIGLFCIKTLKEQFSAFGTRVAGTLGNSKVLLFIGVMAAAYPLYMGISKIFSPTLQGGIFSDIPKDHEENVYQPQDTFRLCEVDVGSQSAGSRSQGFSSTLCTLERSVVCVESRAAGHKTVLGRAICLVGHLYMAPSHVIPEWVEELTVIDAACGTGKLASKLVFTFDHTTAVRSRELDLCLFECQLPPKKDILGFFPSRSMVGGIYRGTLVKRARDGSMEHISAVKIQENTAFVGSPINNPIRSWSYVPGVPTIEGDCGSMLVADTTFGAVVMGMHQTYVFGKATAQAITSEMLKKLVSKFEPQIQGGELDLCGKEMHDLHWKSVFRDVAGSAKVFGSFGNQEFRAAPKTRVAETITCKAALEEGFEIKHTQPCMKGKTPWLLAAQPCAEISGKMDHAIMRECADSYLADCYEAVKDTAEVHQLDTLSEIEAVNGVPGVRFLDKMNRQTSMGFPQKKSKRQFLVPLPEVEDPDHVYQDAVEFLPEIKAEMEKVRTCYRAGKRYNPIFNGCLKDEPVTFKKAKMGKTRVFLSGPAAWSVVVRQTLLPFVRVFQRNPHAFEGAVGINCNSHQWEELRDYLTFFGEETNVAGDYGFYDKRMYAYVIRLAFKIIADFLALCGCSAEQVLFVRCIGEDVAYAWIDFQGDLVQFFGSNPSGHPLTVIINCIVNSLYMRYCYFSLGPKRECRSFKRFVHLITYGDDNESNVCRTIPWFNHTAIQGVLASIDVVYTMADKDAPSVPFIHFSDVSFLKRKWVRDPETGIWLAPLDWDSINKSLTMGTKSDSVCAEAQGAQTIRNIALEMFHHGREHFDENVAKLQRIVEKSGLSSWVDSDAIKTWPEYVEQHRKSSLGFIEVDPAASLL